MIRHSWDLAVLVLGAFRLLRFLSYDEWPPVARARAWVIGEYWIQADVPEDAEKAAGRVDAAKLGLPGKQPSSEVAEVRPAYRRPLLAHLVHCPWCMGFWTSLAVYAAWLAAPRWTLYALVPFALSGAIGLVAKNLDP